MILVVPMDPEYFPEAALIVGGAFAGVAVARALMARDSARATKFGAVTLACILLAALLAATTHRPPVTPALIPASTSKIPNTSMSLVCGGVVLRVRPADHYEFSVENTPFLNLHLHRTELRVTCTVASGTKTATQVVGNTFPVRSGELDIGRSPHSLDVRAEGQSLLRVHYPEPSRIELEGDFFDRRRAEDVLTSVHLISFRKGIEWAGGRLPVGTTMDLTEMEPGRIDFTSPSRVQVVRTR